MRQKGSRVGYFWTIDPSGTCAKAVYSHLSVLKWSGVSVKTLHKCGKSDSQNFKILKPLKISRNFVCGAIKGYKEMWRVEDRDRSGRLKNVTAAAAIKTVRERIRRNPLWKQKIMYRELNITTQSSRASSETIYT